ncbi:esterase [bacterium]|nr:esterase [bacterium]MBP9809755.1 esterase [bacterium]
MRNCFRGTGPSSIVSLALCLSLSFGLGDLPTFAQMEPNERPFQVNEGQNTMFHDPNNNPDSKPNQKKVKKSKVSNKPLDPSLLTGPNGQLPPVDATLIRETVSSEGLEREFFVHVPKGYNHSQKMPLVMCFHGGFGLGSRMDALTGLDAISDQNGFLLVYPQGINRHWNDGRNIDGHDRYNDVQFVTDMIDHLERRWNIDKQRVYVTGVSNGGFFSQYLCIMLPNKFAGCASVGATLPDIVFHTRRPMKPVSVLYILGMSDPLVPFKGGPIHYKSFHDRGNVISAKEAAQYWVKANRCQPNPRVIDLPDVDPNDGTRVKYAQFSGGLQGTEVVVYGIEAGGHTWPGGLQYLPEGTVGKTCRDFSASQALWDFFKNHTSPNAR